MSVKELLLWIYRIQNYLGTEVLSCETERSNRRLLTDKQFEVITILLKENLNLRKLSQINKGVASDNQKCG